MNRERPPENHSFKIFTKGLLLWLLLFLAFSLAAAEPPQGSFEVAKPGYRFSFPRDHGAHPAFQTEWWYFTGHLTSSDRKEYGYELTFFRQGNDHPEVLKNPSRWAPRQLYFAHFAVTDIPQKRFYYHDKISREAIGKAGAKLEHLEVWIDQWHAVQEGENIQLHAEEKNGEAPERWEIDLTLSPAKPPVIHGIEGISKKGEEEGQASHYYSFTRLETKGSIWIGGREEKVSGWSWMDHEFSSSVLNPHQVGWDWFSIQLEDGTDIMLFQIRRENGEKDLVSSGTVVAPDGSRRHLNAGDFTLTPVQHWKSPASGGTYPIGWKIGVPSEQLALVSEPLLSQQELVTSRSTRVAYWEGVSRFRGTKGERPIEGKGYVELTGYAAPLKMKQNVK